MSRTINNVTERKPPRHFTVRLAIKRPDRAMGTTYRFVHGQDADHAAALAVKAAERDTGQSGWVLDGPVEREED